MRVASELALTVTALWSRSKAFRASAAAFAATLLLASCNNPERWKFREEVLLNTGQVIVIERIAKRNNVWPNMGGGGYRAIINQWIEYSPLRFSFEAGSTSSREPLSLGFIGSDFYIAATGQANIEACQRDPTSFVVSLFVLTVDGLREVEASNVLLDGLTQNLLVDVSWGEPSDIKPTFVTVADKSRRSKIDYAKPPSLKAYLEATYGTRCVDVLRSWGLIPLESGKSRDK